MFPSIHKAMLEHPPCDPGPFEGTELGAAPIDELLVVVGQGEGDVSLEGVRTPAR